MKKNMILIGLCLFIVFTTAMIIEQRSRIQESITFFPIDPYFSFKAAHTSLEMMNKSAAESRNYQLKWQTTSILDHKAYLRQDVGLLFLNGRLANAFGGWKGNTDRI